MDEQTDHPYILWVRRQAGGIPNSELINKVLRMWGAGSFVSIVRSTRSHFAVITMNGHRENVAREAITDASWIIDSDYTPSEEEIRERDERNKRDKESPLRRIITVENSDLL